MEKARAVFGFVPEISVHEGLRRSAEFLLLSHDGKRGAGAETPR